MNEELAVTIGAAARAARQHLGLTQAEVAERVGLVPMVYSRLERGKMLPSVPSLYRLCRELGVSPEVMLGLGGESKGRKSRSQEKSSPGLRRLQHLAQRLEEEELEALLHMATVLSR